MSLAADPTLTIFEVGAHRAGGRSSHRRVGVPSRSSGLLPERFRRAQGPRLPEVSEPELVRHYVRLSKRNFDLDSGFYPLGSCTMKHNPRLHERVAALPGPREAASAAAPGAGAGRAGADVEPRARSRRGRRAAARLAAAERRFARRARRRAADEGLPRRPRRAAPHQGADARHGARDEPGDGDDGRDGGRSRSRPTPTAASTSTTCGRRPQTTPPA